MWHCWRKDFVGSTWHISKNGCQFWVFCIPHHSPNVLLRGKQSITAVFFTGAQCIQGRVWGDCNSPFFFVSQSTESWTCYCIKMQCVWKELICQPTSSWVCLYSISISLISLSTITILLPREYTTTIYVNIYYCFILINQQFKDLSGISRQKTLWNVGVGTSLFFSKRLGIPLFPYFNNRSSKRPLIPTCTTSLMQTSDQW